MLLAVVAGAWVWSAIGGAAVIWLASVALSRGRLLGPRRVMRWGLESWFTRLALLAFWAVAGWHVFCQRP